jgi:hypothetical protein
MSRLGVLCERFTEDEVWAAIRSNVMVLFDAFWHRDMHNLHNVNEALLTLLPKSFKVAALKDY